MLQPCGLLHEDCLMNCKVKITGSKLVNATDSEAETYMNLLWTMMVKENCYREWLSHKHSVKYQVVQNKFASEYKRMNVACYACVQLQLCEYQNYWYTKLQLFPIFNNYAEMCSECKIDGSILPLMESFQMRLKFLRLTLYSMNADRNYTAMCTHV